jgi:hypothetical protein
MYQDKVFSELSILKIRSLEYQIFPDSSIARIKNPQDKVSAGSSAEDQVSQDQPS